MKVLNVLKDTVVAYYTEENLPVQAAALSFYMLFSLGPLVLIAIWVASFFISPGMVEGEVRARMEELVGPTGARAAWAMVENAELARRNPLANVLGALLLVLTASRAMGHVQATLNTIWKVRPRASFVKSLLRKRLTSFGMMVIVGFLLVLSLLLNAVFSAAVDWMRQWIQFSPWLIYAGVNIISVLLILVMFAALYQVLPDRRIPWRNVWLGATITTILFVLGKTVVGIYLGSSGVGSAWGAAGSLVLLLLWTYYSAQVFFMGAVLTRRVAETRQGPVERIPEEGVQSERPRPPPEGPTRAPPPGPPPAEG